MLATETKPFSIPSPQDKREYFTFLLRQIRPWAVLSAWLPNLSPQENKARNAALLADLHFTHDRYYRNSIYEQDGHWKGDHEESFLVFGMPKSEALHWGEKYGQECILHSEDIGEVVVSEEDYVSEKWNGGNYSSTFISPYDQIHWYAEVKS